MWLFQRFSSQFNWQLCQGRVSTSSARPGLSLTYVASARLRVTCASGSVDPKGMTVLRVNVRPGSDWLAIPAPTLTSVLTVGFLFWQFEKNNCRRHLQRGKNVSQHTWRVHLQGQNPLSSWFLADSRLEKWVWTDKTGLVRRVRIFKYQVKIQTQTSATRTFMPTSAATSASLTRSSSTLPICWITRVSSRNSFAFFACQATDIRQTTGKWV